MYILRITCTALGLLWVGVPVHAEFGLPGIPAIAEQFIAPEGSELQLNPDPDVFPPGPDLHFGSALALRRNELLVGMPLYHGGRVAVFTRKNAEPWERSGSLDPTDGGGDFGTDIALGRNFAMVQGGGGTYVFQRKNGTWMQTQKLAVRFLSMAIGDGFLFGLHGETVAVFRPDKRGRLQPVQTLTVEEAQGTARQGARLAVSHGTLIVGAPARSGGGSVYIFKRHGQRWLKRQELIAINGEPGDDFGSSVAIDRGLIAIGAPGAHSHGPDCLEDYVHGVAYVFAPQRGLWFEQQKVETPVCEPFAREFASTVAISRGRLAIDVPGQFPNQPRTTFLYEDRGGSFTAIGVTTGGLEANGQAMEMSGSTLVLGWPFERGGYSPGSAYVFELERR